MTARNNTCENSRKLKKLLIVGIMVCYVPLTAGCAQYVMLAMSVASMVSSTVAKHRESKARREAWQKGEPYIEDAATTNWKTSANVTALGALFTSFGSQAGWWGNSHSNTSNQNAEPWVNPDTGQTMGQNNQQAAVGGGGQNPAQVQTQGGKTDIDLGENITTSGAGSNNTYIVNNYYGNAPTSEEETTAHSGTIVDSATSSQASPIVHISADKTKVKVLRAEDKKGMVNSTQTVSDSVTENTGSSLAGTSQADRKKFRTGVSAIENLQEQVVEEEAGSTKNLAVSGRNARNKK